MPVHLAAPAASGVGTRRGWVFEEAAGAVLEGPHTPAGHWGLGRTDHCICGIPEILVPAIQGTPALPSVAEVAWCCLAHQQLLLTRAWSLMEDTDCICIMTQVSLKLVN